MTNALAKYVEDFILNPAATVLSNFEEEGHEESKPIESAEIKGDEGALGVEYSQSKLRMQNAQLIGDKDPRYRGKKASRKKINNSSSKAPSHDPELAKYFLLEEESEEDEQSGKGESTSDQSVSDAEVESSSKSHSSKHEFQEDMDEFYLKMGEDVEEEDDASEDEDSEGSESEGEDEEENEEIEDEEKGEEENEEIEDEEEGIKKNTVKTFSLEQPDQIARGQAVKHQCSIFDLLFETRIGLQKILTIANQLPQFDSYHDFIRSKNYPQYKEKVLVARKAMKKLITQILAFQEMLLETNPETRSVLAAERQEELRDDEDPDESPSEDTKKVSSGLKRKVEEFENTLRKRHKALTPFREETLNKWHEKSKLLLSHTRSNFSGFEVAPSQQIKNILANKQELIKRTQLVGISRGNICRVLGKPENEEEGVAEEEEYDPEKFDDSDFYSRMLESVLKSKLSVSEDMTEVSRMWVDIQKLRKKAKKTVDTKASKGKKIRFEVMSKLQQFLGPCKPTSMDDEAINRLYASLFGQTPNNRVGTVK